MTIVIDGRILVLTITTISSGIVVGLLRRLFGLGPGSNWREILMITYYGLEGFIMATIWWTGR